MTNASSITKDFKLQHTNSFNSTLSNIKPKNEEVSVMKRKRTVRFHPQVSMQETLNIKDYTAPEIARCWYNEAELAQIFTEVQEILSNPKIHPEDREYCCAMWRGLEGMTPQGCKQRQQNKEAGWAAVKSDSRNSSYEPLPCSSIALAYRLTTQLAVLEAKKRASDEEYFTKLRTTTKSRAPKKSRASNLSAWNLHPKQIGSKINKILGRITGSKS